MKANTTVFCVYKSSFESTTNKQDHPSRQLCESLPDYVPNVVMTPTHRPYT